MNLFIDIAARAFLHSHDISKIMTTKIIKTLEEFLELKICFCGILGDFSSLFYYMNDFFSAHATLIFCLGQIQVGQ